MHVEKADLSDEAVPRLIPHFLVVIKPPQLAVHLQHAALLREDCRVVPRRYAVACRLEHLLLPLLVPHLLCGELHISLGGDDDGVDGGVGVLEVALEVTEQLLLAAPVAHLLQADAVHVVLLVQRDPPLERVGVVDGEAGDVERAGPHREFLNRVLRRADLAFAVDGQRLSGGVGEGGGADLLVAGRGVQHRIGVRRRGREGRTVRAGRRLHGVHEAAELLAICGRWEVLGEHVVPSLVEGHVEERRVGGGSLEANELAVLVDVRPPAERVNELNRSAHYIKQPQP